MIAPYTETQLKVREVYPNAYLAVGSFGYRYIIAGSGADVGAMAKVGAAYFGGPKDPWEDALSRINFNRGTCDA